MFSVLIATRGTKPLITVQYFFIFQIFKMKKNFDLTSLTNNFKEYIGRKLFHAQKYLLRKQRKKKKLNNVHITQQFIHTSNFIITLLYKCSFSAFFVSLLLPNSINSKKRHFQFGYFRWSSKLLVILLLWISLIIWSKVSFIKKKHRKKKKMKKTCKKNWFIYFNN